MKTKDDLIIINILDLTPFLNKINLFEAFKEVLLRAINIASRFLRQFPLSGVFIVIFH